MHFTNPERIYFVEKTTCRNKSFCLVEAGGDSRFASYLLDDPNAMHFGTRLRTFSTADNSQDCLLIVENPLRVRLPLNRCKQKRAPSGTLFLSGGGGGSRTPVRKHIHTDISGCSLWLTFPQPYVHRQTHGLGSFISHVRRKA